MLSLRSRILAVAFSALVPLVAASPAVSPGDGRVYCDQGDKGVPRAFAQDIINNINTNQKDFGIPGRDGDFGFGSSCLSHSQGGGSYCCQVAYLNTNGNVGTVTMTANTKSTGADALGGKTDGATLKSLATDILNTCWSGNGDHSGRWAGAGFQLNMLSLRSRILAVAFSALVPLVAASPAVSPGDGRVYCDQGDKGVPRAFAQDIINNINTNQKDFGIPGRDGDFGFGSSCLSHSQGGGSYCCQVAYLNTNGNVGTVTMTANTKSTGADALGGKTDGATLKSLATDILNTCWSGNGDHSGRWAGAGFQVGLSGGTC
ncbi:hypothetical protein GLOTRDRAFT_131901 [Gloeophyllum trabeum ATCC 11539]|uniref:Ecp2 effector protein domain-containing protein n=1 Tax=Gloeophyllum trabeum (strain ATCC 11539 / FP-39264 / Madison 617) TaxID=670483 RepID=S7REJ8_GLOTA|nr:uncharacterized protein GLOTRDRAFT_131901 [Gloeophyllum trabeum ATCC 11539]EPQ52665.1 hypothetical protein GLOTRDRAFT_131901 [Gloeophyllum trabeum ATCC 11539]